MSSRESIAKQLRDARFTPRRLKAAYDMGQVDAFLDRMVEALVTGSAVGPVLDSARLQEVRLREGYDIDEVDAFLLAVATEASEFDPSAVESAHRLRAGARSRVEAPKGESQAASVIEESRGFWQRFVGRRN